MGITVPCLVVGSGPDTGARLVVDREPLLIGRAREADLVLTDPSVSRVHLHAGRAPSRLAVKLIACQGVKPLLVGDREEREVEVGIGERVVIGNTVLLVAEVEVPSPKEDGAAAGITTQIHVLLSGIASDVRGFAALYQLNEALASARDGDGIEAAVRKWGKSHVDVEAVEFLAPSEAPQGAALIERTTVSGTSISVPTHGLGTSRIVFSLGQSSNRISDGQRRLLLLAGAICGSNLGRMHTLAAAEADRNSMRTQALGSARAFLGNSPAAQEIARILPRVAASDVTALLLGETGVGKTFVARLLHESGPRAREHLRVINCAAVPDALIESELFGHERGAFSGAIAARIGALEAAGAGTVLLDEIGELSPTSQTKLLRVLEERRFERLGSNRTIPLRARILVATNRDLSSMVSAGQFRSDLFFRIAVVTLTIPPLREREGDLVLLAEQILSDLAITFGRRIDGFAPDALDVIMGYNWPGNVRELRNAIEHAVVLGDGRAVQASDLPLSIRAVTPSPPQDESNTVKLPAPLDWLEERAIDAALAVAGGNKMRASALLGIKPAVLYYKLRQVGRSEA